MNNPNIFKVIGAQPLSTKSYRLPLAGMNLLVKTKDNGKSCTYSLLIEQNRWDLIRSVENTFNQNRIDYQVLRGSIANIYLIEVANNVDHTKS